MTYSQSQALLQQTISKLPQKLKKQKDYKHLELREWETLKEAKQESKGSISAFLVFVLSYTQTSTNKAERGLESGGKHCSDNK